MAPPATSAWPSAQPVAGATYESRNLQSGLLAAVPAGATGTAQLVQRTRGDQGAQFVVQPTGTGYELRNKQSGLCADVDSASTAENASVLQYTCHGGNNQIWRVVVNPAGGTSFVNVNSGKCLAPLGGSLDSGAGLVQVTCGLARSQRWDLGVAPVADWPAVSPISTNPYELVNVGAGLYAGSPAGSTSFNGVVLRAQGPGARFTLVPNPDGTHLLKEPSVNGCVDDSAQGGTTVGLWYCTVNDQQSWKLLQHPLGGVAIVNLGNGECLGTVADATSAGTKLSQEPCTTAATRRWTLTEVGTTPPPPPQTSYFENTTDFLIPDNNATGVSSPLTVARTGNAPSTLKVAVRIIHPYVGDLVVDLIAPDGTVYQLQSRKGGSADNLIATFTVNASSELASGTWKLRVADRGWRDTGKIDSWSLQF